MFRLDALFRGHVGRMVLAVVCGNAQPGPRFCGWCKTGPVRN